MSGIKTDLTAGSVQKNLIKYAVPMVTTSLLQAVYSIIDIIVAGRFVGGNAISGINNASLVMNMITNIAIGFTIGGNILIGQYFGSKDEENQKKAAGTLFAFSILLGMICMVLFYPLSGSMLKALGAPALSEATTYLKICSLGLIFIFGYNALSAMLRAVGNSKKPMHFIIISSGLNVVLDLVFVGGLHMGVMGAALGTLISQGVAFFAALIYVWMHREELGFTARYLKICVDKLKLIAKLGFPLALQWTVASISWLVVMVLINRYGVDVSAGNGVSNKIKDFCQLFIAAMTSAASTMAAQNLGAGEYDRAKQVMKVCLRITAVLAIVSIAVAEIFAPQLVSIFTSEAEVAIHAVRNLRIEIIAQIFYALFMSYNVLGTACGDTMFVMANSFLNCIIIRLLLALILEHFFGIVGVYVACMIAPGSSVPVGFAYYRSGKWKKRLTA